MSAAVAADYGLLRKIVFSHSRNVLDPSSDYLFDARLARLLRNRGLSSVDELIHSLRHAPNPALERAIAEAMTINETSFFRDGRPFELLRSVLLPKIIDARRNTRTLRFWSAACSTGQEAYSIAMLLREHFPMVAGWTLRIEGTDISSEVVQKAGSGRYQRLEINRGLPARHIIRFFDHLGEEWAVKPEIRRLCNFRQANLCAPRLPFAEPFDVIFLRNVMIYFSRETRLALLAGIHRLLTPDGILFLGSAEQPPDLSLWTSALEGGTCYFRPQPVA